MENKNLIDKAIEFIQKTPKDNLSLQSIADHAGFSLTYFDAIFRQHTGYNTPAFTNSREARLGFAGHKSLCLILLLISDMQPPKVLPVRSKVFTASRRANTVKNMQTRQASSSRRKAILPPDSTPKRCNTRYLAE